MTGGQERTSAVKRMWASPWRPFGLLIVFCWLAALATCVGG
jgi:hypothetical protein